MKTKILFLARESLSEQIRFSISNQLLGIRTVVSILSIPLITFAGCKKIHENSLATGADATTNQMRTSSVTGDEFTIAVLPDTQNYMAEKPSVGGLRGMFYAQIDWIKANKVSENIAYVAGLGDITDCGDNYPDQTVPVQNRSNTRGTQWAIAVNATHGYYALETPLTGLPNGIPYGLTVGNHDQLPITRAFRSATEAYNNNFGRSRFSPRGYWGTAFTEPGNKEKNDNHYDTFTVNGQGYIVGHIEYDDAATDGSGSSGDGPPDDWQTNLVPNWIAEKFALFPDRKAIIVTHSAVGTSGSFSEQGGRIYSILKKSPNVFALFCGHFGGNGEAYRERTFEGRTIRCFLSDYQGRVNGGNGLMRLYTFSPSKGTVRVRTINPYTGVDETDSDSQFTKPMYHNQTSSRTNDFDNDGKSQLVCFNNGVWQIEGQSNVTFGASGDIAVPADYDGDGKTDLAYYRPSNGTWNVQGKSAVTWGTIAGDIPVPGDYTDMEESNAGDHEDRDSSFTTYQHEKADGIADFAFWRPGDRNWWVKGPTAAADTNVLWGQAVDILVPGDYNGDGKVNFAVFKITATPCTWNFSNSAGSGVTFGQANDIPVPGDYDGNGVTDIAVFRRSNHTCYIYNQSSVNMSMYVNGDIPVPGDYNGDGKTDVALYRPSTGELFINDQTTHSTGIINGKPVNLPYCISKVFFP